MFIKYTIHGSPALRTKYLSSLCLFTYAFILILLYLSRVFIHYIIHCRCLFIELRNITRGARNRSAGMCLNAMVLVHLDGKRRWRIEEYCFMTQSLVAHGMEYIKRHLSGNKIFCHFERALAYPYVGFQNRWVFVLPSKYKNSASLYMLVLQTPSCTIGYIRSVSAVLLFAHFCLHTGQMQFNNHRFVLT